MSAAGTTSKSFLAAVRLIATGCQQAFEAAELPGLLSALTKARSLFLEGVAHLASPDVQAMYINKCLYACSDIRPTCSLVQSSGHCNSHCELRLRVA